MADPIIGGLYERCAGVPLANLYLNPTNNIDVDFLFPGRKFICLSKDTLLLDGQVWYLQYRQDAFWDLTDLIQVPD